MNKLIELYNNTSKHSNYQSLASPLVDFIPTSELNVQSRFEAERLSYMLKKISVEGKTTADIGGNTGFFTFEYIARGANSGLLIEGNKSHAAFVEEASKVLKWSEKISSIPEYVNFEDDLAQINVDVCLLLNVLHHVGDDYGDQSQSIISAKENILTSLNRMTKCAETLIFQLGFNWKGNRNQPLFENGTKEEMINFIESGVSKHWKIETIGIAEKSEDKIVYKDLNSKNIERDDSLGEFLNRPLFILKRL